ncbi:unnamed protein product, partial [Symbiodinium sp. CCMP2592]
KKRFNYSDVHQVYGRPGNLTLKQMYANWVPEQHKARDLQAHRALDDVYMMQDVMKFAPYLAPLLAQDISMAAHGTDIPAVSNAVCQRLLHPAKPSQPSQPPHTSKCQALPMQHGLPVMQSVLLKASPVINTLHAAPVSTATPPPPQFAAPAVQPLQLQQLQPTPQQLSHPQELQAQASSTVSLPSDPIPPPEKPSPASPAQPSEHVLDTEAELQSSGCQSRRTSASSIETRGKGTGKVESKGKGKKKKEQHQQNHQRHGRYEAGWWGPDPWNWEHAWAGGWWGQSWGEW